MRLFRVGRRPAALVQRPALGQLLALLRREEDLALRGDARRHVDDDVRPFGAGHGEGERVGRHEGRHAAPGRHVRRAVRRREADHVRAWPPSSPSRRRCRSGCCSCTPTQAEPASFALRMQTSHREVRDDRAHAVVAVDERGRRRSRRRLAARGRGVDRARAQPLDVDAEHPGDAVGVDAAQVGLDQRVGLDPGVRLRAARPSDEDVVGEVSQRLDWEAGTLALVASHFILLDAACRLGNTRRCWQGQ